MVVNSVFFWIFFIIVLALYFSILRKNVNAQNLWLLLSSYFFYGYSGGKKMVILLLLATVIFYCLGLTISKQNGKNEKKASIYTSLGVVLGICVLLYFKYLNFFIESFSEFFKSIGLQTNWSTFKIIMPIGVSFFTFKLISYIIEVHRETITPCKNFIQFALYISFFPTIMSGPIDRPGTFLPQLAKVRPLDYTKVSEGCRRILWGMFLKMCIADNIVAFTDNIFINYQSHNGASLSLASILYVFQLYTDFAGYSDMAIGVGQIMGIQITENFNRPFFSHDLAEYWRRWHMSLTTWLTDYVFTPLNLSFRNWGMWGLNIAVIINLFLIGMWHGANWAYAVFGLYHGLMLAIINLTTKKRKKFEKKHQLKNNTTYQYSRICLTFILIIIGDTLFRCTSATMCFDYFKHMFTSWGSVSGTIPYFAISCMILVLLKEFKDEYGYNIHLLHSSNKWIKLLTCYLLLILVFLMGNTEGVKFIYFQF